MFCRERQGKHGFLGLRAFGGVWGLSVGAPSPAILTGLALGSEQP